MPPAIPIIAAVGSMAAGYAAVTAAGASMLGLIAGGAMMAGGALSLVGAATKNQKLSKWGGIISAVGGIAAIGNGLATAVGNQLAGEGGQLAAAGAAEAGEQTVAQAAQAGAGSGGEVASSFIDPSAAAVAGETTGGGLLANAAPGLDTAAGMAGSDLAAGISPLQDTVGAAAQQAANQGASSLAGAAPLGEAGSTLAGTQLAGAAAPGAAGGSTSILGDVSSFMKNNKELVDIGSGFLKGAMQSGDKEKELLAYLREKEDAENRQRAAYSASVTGSAGVPFRINQNANLSTGQVLDPTRYRSPAVQPVAPAQPVARPAVPGFLNTAMQGR